MEIWKPVPNTENVLWVSDQGRVRSESFTILDKKRVNQTFKPIFKKLTLGNNGYYQFRFRGVLYLLHRVIAESFIPNPENKPCVNHKDGNKLNNGVNNLEWCTYSENNKHAWETGLIITTDRTSVRGELNHLSKLKEEDIVMILENFKKDKSEQITQAALARKYGVTSTAIYNIRKGYNWKHLGEING